MNASASAVTHVRKMTHVAKTKIVRVRQTLCQQSALGIVSFHLLKLIIVWRENCEAIIYTALQYPLVSRYPFLEGPII